MRIIGHRGAKGLAPENTIASIKRALEFDLDEIEIDVRNTSDGIAILYHDEDLRRLCNTATNVADITYEEFKKLKSDLTTLEDAITFIDKRVPLRIEIKPDISPDPLINVLESVRAKGWRDHDFVISSFSQKPLLAIKSKFPDTPLSVNERFSSLRAVYRARQLGTKNLVMNHRFLWFGIIRIMSRQGYNVSPYTMNDPIKVEAWSKYGLYGVVTDYPDRFRPTS